MQNLTLCFARPSSGKNPHEPIVVASPKPQSLPEHHVLIKLDRFGFSTNNVTYQALGEAPHFRYFEFHPAPALGDISPSTHGLIPVWGFGTVIDSTHPRISAGERVYGYFAPTRYLLLPVSPSDVNKYSFFVPRPHLPADRRPYNQVTRCTNDPQYDSSPVAEDLTMLYRPLFWTAYWCEDWLHASGYRGATSILVSSASAKTAFCLAYLVKKRGDGVHITGLTSTRNFAFTKGLGLYDEVLSYDSLHFAATLRAKETQWLYIDVAGNNDLNERVKEQFVTSGNLLASVQLGLTNLSPSAPTAATTKFTTNTSLINPTSERTDEFVMEQFFMPEWLAVRRNQLSISQITEMQLRAWRDLMRDGQDWVKIKRVYGGPAVASAYKEMTTNGTDPMSGMIWSLWDGPELGREVKERGKL